MLTLTVSRLGLLEKLPHTSRNQLRFRLARGDRDMATQWAAFLRLKMSERQLMQAEQNFLASHSSPNAPPNFSI